MSAPRKKQTFQQEIPNGEHGLWYVIQVQKAIGKVGVEFRTMMDLTWSHHSTLDLTLGCFGKRARDSRLRFRIYSVLG